jgi:hypothetical protein
VIITSYLFPNGVFSQERLGKTLEALGGDPEKLVIDLSCRKKGDSWFVAMNKWQTITGFELSKGSFHRVCHHFANRNRQYRNAGAVLLRVFDSRSRC